LSTFYVPGVISGAGDTVGDKTAMERHDTLIPAEKTREEWQIRHLGAD
jgi:hypothetical protein